MSEVDVPAWPKKRKRRVRFVLFFILGGVALLLWRPWIEAYPLDAHSRVVVSAKTFRCPEVKLKTYRGTTLRYHRPVKVHPAFAERLARFERIVAQTAKVTYGRAPRRIVHMGSYNCRRIRGSSWVLSEHALGNAIDVSGFDFGRAKHGPRRWRRSFRVRLASHWKSKGGTAAHRRFLRKLDRRTRAEGLFRNVIGPGSGGHSDHFHLDHAPSIGGHVIGAIRGLW